MMRENPKGAERKRKLKELVKERVATKAAIAKASRSHGGTQSGSCLAPHAHPHARTLPSRSPQPHTAATAATPPPAIPPPTQP